MKTLLTTTALVLAGSMAFAADTTEQTATEKLQNDAAQAGEAIEDTAQSAGEVLENTAEDAGQAIANTAEDAEQALENTAEDTERAAENAAESTAQAADEATDEMAEEAGDLTPEAEMQTETMTAGSGTFLDSGTMGGHTILATDLIGKYVYGAEGEIDMTATYTEDSLEWENIGDVGDILISADGQTRSILLDVGGFLGIGEHTVAINMDELVLVRDGNDEDDFFVVVRATEEQLKAAPEFDRSRVGMRMDADMN